MIISIYRYIPTRVFSHPKKFMYLHTYARYNTKFYTLIPKFEPETGLYDTFYPMDVQTTTLSKII